MYPVMSCVLSSSATGHTAYFGTVEVQGAVLPIMAYTGRLRPKGVPFPGFRYIKGQGFYTEVYERVGESVIWVCKRAQRDEQMNFMTL